MIYLTCLPNEREDLNLCVINVDVSVNVWNHVIVKRKIFSKYYG